MDENIEKKQPKTPEAEMLPLLPLRGLCVFPEMLMNFDVERFISTAALDAAEQYGRQVLLVTQRDIMKEEPRAEDLYTIGTVCRIKQMLRVTGGGTKVLVEGISRAKIVSVSETNGYYLARFARLRETELRGSAPRLEALRRRTIELFDTYTSMNNVVPRELLQPLYSMDNPCKIADYIAQHMFLRHDIKQTVLETLPPVRRLTAVAEILAGEIEVLGIERELDESIREHMGAQQREHILREHMRAIQAELGEGEGGDEALEYRMRALALDAPEEVKKKLLKEIERLEKQSFSSAEGAVIRTYLDTVFELPWGKSTRERRDVSHAKKLLDGDHFGLDKVKARILEFIAVRQLAPENKGTILCLVGPPGTGKTSVAISIAKALNRRLARLSLGGVHDEAEIRGHRKTYVGAMPGRIMDAISRAGSANPLLLLDEIDKLGSDYRGDPSAALLEALDPEQNRTFRDHYLEIPFDLSEVIFITTANTAGTIPRPLLDRMEVIELDSYTDMEKLEIATRYLLPKQRRRHGLSARSLKMSDTAILSLVDGWTRESGVRGLERELAAICRKAAAEIVAGEVKSVSITPAQLERTNGPRKYTPEVNIGGEIGVVRGLAWTQVGGTTLDVEVNILPGTGALKLTGNLGSMMKESAEAAVSYIRSRAEKLNISPNFHKERDIHIHFPEGAVPKDGPSAGMTMALAVISALTGAPVRRDIAMTGEITIRGRIMRIGGLKEKSMAALRAGIKTVIIPAENERDLEEIDQTVRRALNFVSVRCLDAALGVALDFDAVQKPQEPASASAPEDNAEPLQKQRKAQTRVRQ